MIKILALDDLNNILDLFGEKQEDYQLVLDTIIDNNFTNPSVTIYGEFGKDGLNSILLHNGGNLTYYAKEIRSVKVYEELLMTLDYFKISCEKKFIDKFMNLIGSNDVEHSKFGYIHKPISSTKNTSTLGYKVDELNIEPNLISEDYLYPLINVDPNIIARASSIVENNNQRIYCLSKDGKAYASAMVVLMQSHSAVIHGVMTSKEMRQNGLSYTLLTHIFNQLLMQGKHPYLFYTNPAARNLFLKMGMKEIGDWSILYK